MTKTDAYLRAAEDDGARPRPTSEFHAGRTCSVTVIAVPCPTADDVRAQAARVRALRAQAFKPRVVSSQGEHPKENGEGTLTVSQAQAGAESDGADAFGAIAERPAAVPGRINVHRVLEVAADHFRIPLRDLTSHSRPQPLVRRRQIAMYVARETTARSLPFIGKKIGGRDHTTVLHGVRLVKGLIEAGDAETIAAVDQIIERLQVGGGAHD
jgi:Bacterial dnaA protein helix-turn-helix